MCTQKSDEPIYNFYNQLQTVYKENSSFPSDVDSTLVDLTVYY